MSDPDPKRKLEELEIRLAKLRAAGQPEKPHQQDYHSQAQLAWRMVTEMVAGLAIGFGIGFGLDTLLGSTPWLMVTFTVLGIVAGIRVMMRSAAELQTDYVPPEDAGDLQDEDAFEADEDEGNGYGDGNARR